MKFNGLKATFLAVSLSAIASSSVASEIIIEDMASGSSTVTDSKSRYAISGAENTYPSQVFSDGQDTYFEFGKSLKPLYAVADGRKLKFKYAKPYHVIEGEYDTLAVYTSRGKFEIERQIGVSQTHVAAAPAPAGMSHGSDQSSLSQRVGLTLPRGLKLSEALADYVRANGWTLKWNIDVDYMVEEPIPMRGEFVDSIYDLVKTYQLQGGMEGTIPMFSKSNHVVSIEKLDNTQR